MASLYAGKVVPLPSTGRLPALAYRADVLAARGIEVLETWEEFLEAARQLNGTGTHWHVFSV